MKHLKPVERKVWQAIAADKNHPWYSLAIEALNKEANYKTAKKLIRKLTKTHQ